MAACYIEILCTISVCNYFVLCAYCINLSLTCIFPLYVSNCRKEDYDLCSICFSKMGSEADYIRLDHPVSYRHPWSIKGLYDYVCEFIGVNDFLSERLFSFFFFPYIFTNFSFIIDIISFFDEAAAPASSTRATTWC